MWERYVYNLGSENLRCLDRCLYLSSHSEIDPFDKVFFRNTDFYAFQIMFFPDFWIKSNRILE